MVFWVLQKVLGSFGWQFFFIICFFRWIPLLNEAALTLPQTWNFFPISFANAAQPGSNHHHLSFAGVAAPSNARGQRWEMEGRIRQRWQRASPAFPNGRHPVFHLRSRRGTEWYGEESKAGNLSYLDCPAWCRSYLGSYYSASNILYGTSSWAKDERTDG